MLVLELLGTLSLRGEPDLVPPAAQQKRRLGLLAILALAERQGLSRQRIESYLWPESNAARARHALDQAVYGIRRALGTDLIISTAQELRLNREFIRADVWEFDDALSAKQWTVAADLYKGPLLDGFHFGDSREVEEWIDAERARMLLEYQAAIELLANDAASAENSAQEIAWRRRLARSDPLSADPVKKLIVALAAAGDRTGAVQQARQYQELVRQQLEMEPDSEIERLIGTFSQPSAAESDSNAATPHSSPRVAASVDTESPPLGDESPAKPRFRDGPLRARFRLQRSRIVALASLAVMAALVVGAVAMKSGRERESSSTVAENGAGH